MPLCHDKIHIHAFVMRAIQILIAVIWNGCAMPIEIAANRWKRARERERDGVTTKGSFMPPTNAIIVECTNFTRFCFDHAMPCVLCIYAI